MENEDLDEAYEEALSGSPVEQVSPTIEVLPPEESQSDPLFNRTDLDILAENRALRKALIGQLAPKGRLPMDKSDKTMLLALMNGLDSEVLTRARIKVAAKTEESVNDIRAMVSHALLNCSIPRAKPFSEADLKEPDHIKFKPPVPGQMDIGVKNLTMQDIEED